MNNLRKFETEAEYSAATLNYPSVSWVTATDNVYFDKTSPVVPMLGDLRITYNVTSTTEPTQLIYDSSGSGSGSGSGWGGFVPSQMWVDGVEVAVNDTYTFSTTGDHIVEFELGEGVSWLYDNAFGGYKGGVGMTSVEIGGEITTIGYEVFCSCTSLTSVTIPNSVAVIGDRAFYQCTSLTNIVIPDSVTNIGSYCFAYSTSLTSITINATTPPTLVVYVFDDTNNCPIYVPSGSVNAYKAASGWSTYASRIQAIP